MVYIYKKRTMGGVKASFHAALKMKRSQNKTKSMGKVNSKGSSKAKVKMITIKNRSPPSPRPAFVFRPFSRPASASKSANANKRANTNKSSKNANKSANKPAKNCTKKGNWGCVVS